MYRLLFAGEKKALVFERIKNQTKPFDVTVNYVAINLYG